MWSVTQHHTAVGSFGNLQANDHAAPPPCKNNTGLRRDKHVFDGDDFGRSFCHCGFEGNHLPPRLRRIPVGSVAKRLKTKYGEDGHGNAVKIMPDQQHPRWNPDTVSGHSLERNISEIVECVLERYLPATSKTVTIYRTDSRL